MKKFSSNIVKLLFCVLWFGSALPLEAALVPNRSVLDSGMVLLTSQQRALPIVSIELLIDAGSRYDNTDREGLANLTARLLTYGTKRRSALQISETLDFIGASLSASCGQDLASVSLTILKKDLPTGLELLADILTASTFPQEEIDRQQASHQGHEDADHNRADPRRFERWMHAGKDALRNQSVAGHR